MTTTCSFQEGQQSSPSTETKSLPGSDNEVALNGLRHIMVCGEWKGDIYHRDKLIKDQAVQLHKRTHVREVLKLTKSEIINFF